MSEVSTFTTTIEPRFCETDAIGHIGNTTMPCWLEHARKPIFEALHPSMNVMDWPLIVAKVNIDYLAQVYVDSDVTVETGVSHVGNKSFTVLQKVYQNGKQVSQGETVIVYFDFKTKTTSSIPDESRKFLRDHMFQ